MAFSQSSITSVKLVREDDTLAVRWTSSAAAGTIFQVYMDGKRAWSGTAKVARFPWPSTRVQIEVGTVAAGEALTDFSGSLPAPGGSGDRATLTWLGGSYLGDTSDFRIYRSATAGGAIDYTGPIAIVEAYPASVALDGFGMGGFGKGGFGLAATTYSWTSPPLPSGPWSFGIVAVDSAGNETGTPVTTTIAISSRPYPPAPFSDLKRLHYTYNAGTRVATLSWNAASTGPDLDPPIDPDSGYTP